MTSFNDPPTVLIAALSGRALAAAARRAGYVPLVADLFDDLDTRAMAGASTLVAGSLARGFAHDALLDSLDRLATGSAPEGVVCGSGFEDRPKLLRAVAARHTLLGNTAATVARVKDPLALAALCKRLDIPHPTVRRAPEDRGSWLRKRAGASGGGHVEAARLGQTAKPGEYVQRRVEGTAVSALFLADGRHALMLGLSRQWADPTQTRPYRYGGAVRPAALSETRAVEIAGIIGRLVPATGLVGLNSADFMVRTDGLDLIEINPRPCATIDIFADDEGQLFRLHVDACLGHLPDVAPTFPPAAAACVIYAPRPLLVSAEMAWPDWSADRQPSGRVREGAPLCTVLADETDADRAERLVRARATTILSLIEDTP
ncbi:MAG: ATP-grasp domain-containing protein [Acetobacteraceae bacterium]